MGSVGRLLAASCYKIIFWTLMAIQEVLVGRGTLAKLLGTDLPPFLSCFTIWRLRHLLSERLCPGKTSVAKVAGVLLKTCSSGSGGTSESHVSALQAWCLQSPRDGRSMVLLCRVLPHYLCHWNDLSLSFRFVQIVEKLTPRVFTRTQSM